MSCKATTKKAKEVAETETSNALTPFQGTWELCSSSGGTYGDFKFTHHIAGDIYSYTEYRFLSKDGSCTTPILRRSGVQTIKAQSGIPPLWPDAVEIDVTFSAHHKITALTGDTEALDGVISCSGESAPAVGVSYNIINDCDMGGIFYSPAVANQKLYTIFYIDYSRLPELYLSQGSIAPPEDGKTEAKRNTFLDITEFRKQ